MGYVRPCVAHKSLGHVQLIVQLTYNEPTVKKEQAVGRAEVAKNSRSLRHIPVTIHKTEKTL